MNSSIFNTYFKRADALLISSWGNITFLTNYSGFSKEERECFLLITKRKKFLITDKRYSQALKKQVINFEIIDKGASGFISQNFFQIINNSKKLILGIEENDLTVSEYRKIKKVVGKTVNIDLEEIRISKHKKEIENIKNACALGDKTFKFILGKLKTGVSEKQIAHEIEFFIKSKGADIAFKPITAFGKNSAIPHHFSNKTKLKKNQIILLDFGVKINNYCSDMTRTLFFGKAPEKFKKIHKAVLEAQTKAIQFINSQLSIVNGQLLASDIDKIARSYIIKQDFPDIIHSVGHGIGIEVHEAPHLSPKSKDIIKPGMVFSIEPGIYIKGYGGVRIEDLVVIGKNGTELISHSNREIIEL